MARQSQRGAEFQADLNAGDCENCYTRYRGSGMGSGLLHWVVQRDAKTGVLITFVCFADYGDAERRKVELEAIGDPLDQTVVVAIESHPVGAFPIKASKRSSIS